MPTDITKLSAAFKTLAGNRELVIQLLDLLPTPAQILTPDGTCIFINQAQLKQINCPDASLIVEHYNFNDDPDCKRILGQDIYDRVSRGEFVFFQNFHAPIDGVAKRGILAGKPYEAATMDLSFIPLWDGDTFVYTILYYTLKKVYQGRPEIVSAVQYIDDHWRDEFNLDDVARVANISRRYFHFLFKETLGMTPIEYYRAVKLEKIQEILLTEPLSIEQTFEACGVNSRGAYLKYFKEKTGMTPLEYRKATSVK